eukprot:SAG31_NODE_5031_length_2792_cov_2.309320_5_plen_144_part_00
MSDTLLLSRFCATTREIRDFTRERYGTTNRESGTLQDMFHELHSASLLAEFGGVYRIGTLRRTEVGAREPEPTQRPGAEKPAAQTRLPPRATAIASPFPHRRFEGTGVEAFRFQWALAPQVRSYYFLVCVPAIREIRDFYREM